MRTAAWLRGLRALLAVFVVGFAVFVATAFRHEPRAPEPAVATRVDPTAIVESAGGTVSRITGSHEDGTIHYEHLLTYADGSSRMTGIQIVSPDHNGRTYTIEAKEARVGKDESTTTLTGDVHATATDGLSVWTDDAEYTEASGMLRTSGPVRFSRDRLSGSGRGMTYNTKSDVLVILAEASIHVAPDADGAGRADIEARTASFPRLEHVVSLEGGVTITRDAHVIVAESAIAHLTDGEERVHAIELHDRARVSTQNVEPGGMQTLSADAIDLDYRDDGATLQRAELTGNAAVQFAAIGGATGRQISARALQIDLAEDGTTPAAMSGRTNVRLTFPASSGSSPRRVRADALTATGAAGKGLTAAHLTGNVDFREPGKSDERIVKSGVLDVTLKPLEGTIEEAEFSRTVRLAEGDLNARAAVAKYDPARSTVVLSGVEPAPGPPAPRVVNDQIDVQATSIELILDGPRLLADGSVKSIIKPASGRPGPEVHHTRMPALLKQDQPVNVTSDKLGYDDAASKALYTGAAWLWQGDTSIKADTLVLDGETGNLTANGSVTSTTILTEKGDDGSSERVTSVATAKVLTYEDDVRRATYTGEAHLSGSERDMAASKIELYLTESGDELERAEAYDNITLREQQRQTKGARLTYTASDEKYVVTGAPASIVDECGRETRGQRISFLKGSDAITVDGGSDRATTRGGSCPPGS